MIVFRRKSIEHMVGTTQDHGPRLRRDLSVWNLVTLGIGAIIGTGIFVLIGTAIVGDAHRPGAGPGIILSFLLSGIACALAALCYAEFAAMMPVAGSAYTYTYATLGELLAWLTGWNLILEYGVAAGAVAIGWSGYLVNVLGNAGILLPASLTHSPWEDHGGLLNLPAAVISLVMTGILYVGTKRSARVAGLVVGLKIAIILVFLAIGMGSINFANWQPFLPNGYQGVGAAAAIVFFAYVGFDAISTTAEEATHPQRDVPIALLGSLGICTLLYVLVAGTLTGLVPTSNINIHAPVADALRLTGFRWGSAVVAIGALAGITSVLLVMMLGQIRIFFAMSRDGLLTPRLARIHSRFQTPSTATVVTGLGVSILAAFVPISDAADMTNIGTLFAFVIVCFGVLWLRYRRPELHRPFRLPFMPWTPLLGAISCFGLMLFLPGITWVRFVVWTTLGIVLYFVYSQRHSHLHNPGT